jgi:hypothetical protein
MHSRMQYLFRTMSNIKHDGIILGKLPTENTVRTLGSGSYVGSLYPGVLRCTTMV